MSTRLKPVIKVAIVVGLLLAVLSLFGRAVADSIADALGRLIGLSMFLVSVSFLPVLVLVLGWFVYSVWGRTYLRAWHISRIRTTRQLREAIERGRSEE